MCHLDCPLHGLLELDNLEEVMMSFVEYGGSETQNQLGHFVSEIEHARPDIKLCLLGAACQTFDAHCVGSEGV